MADNALVSVLRIHRKMRLMDAEREEPIVPTPQGSYELAVSGCIICCSEVADTLLMPCKHVVLCAVCLAMLPAFILDALIRG